MDKSKNPERIGYILIFAAGALWGTIGLFVKQMAAGGADALMISFLRVMFAFAIMLLFTVVKGGRKALAVGKRTLIFSILLGMVCHGVYNIFYSYAVTISGVTVSAVLLNIAPVFTFLVSARCFSEKANEKKIIALVVNIAGCILTATGGKLDFDAAAITGILCGVGAGFCYGMTAIFGRFANEDSDPLAVSTYSYLFAALLLLIPARPWKLVHVTAPGSVVFYGILFALIPTAIGYVLYYYGLQRVKESSKVPVIASVETVAAAILGIVIYMEKVNPVSLAGIVIVLLSIYILAMSSRPQKS